MSANKPLRSGRWENVGAATGWLVTMAGGIIAINFTVHFIKTVGRAYGGGAEFVVGVCMPSAVIILIMHAYYAVLILGTKLGKIFDESGLSFRTLKATFLTLFWIVAHYIILVSTGGLVVKVYALLAVNVFYLWLYLRNRKYRTAK